MSSTDNRDQDTATPATEPALAEDGWIDTPDYPHRIENHVKVYLHLEEGTAPGGRGEHRWAVSSVTADGYPLDGAENGNYCDYEGHPIGARPDWDAQHQAAENLDLPTAHELLPLLADAVGTSVEGPTDDQQCAAADLIAEYSSWRSARADLSAGEATGDFPASSDWQDSDDRGCDLAERAISLLADITGQEISSDEPARGATSETDVAIAQSLPASMEAAENRLRQRASPPSSGEHRPPAGPTR